MTLEVEGKVVNTDEEGYLLDPNDWDECLAEAIAGAKGLERTQIHWGLANYFRTYIGGPHAPSIHARAGEDLRQAPWQALRGRKNVPRLPLKTLPAAARSDGAQAGLPKPVGEIGD